MDVVPTPPPPASGRLSFRARPRMFGQFLVDHGVVTCGELKQALDLMGVVNRSIGQLAVERGLLSQSEADAVYRLQRDVDGRWGEIALTLGLGRLTAEALQDLCDEQSFERMRLSDALVDLDCVSATAIEQWVCRYEDERDADGPQLELPPAYQDLPAVRHALDCTPRVLRRLLDCPVVVGRLGPWCDDARLHGESAVGLTGATGIVMGVTADTDTLDLIAGRPQPAIAPQRSGLAAIVHALGEHVRRRIQADLGPSLLERAIESARFPATGVALDLALGTGHAILVLHRPGRAPAD